MAEARALHVVVGDLHDELGAQRLPREVLSLAPAALASGHALVGRLRAAPVLPGVIRERVLAVRLQDRDELASLLVAEARRDPDVVQRSVVVVEAQQERPHPLARAALVPAK